MDVTSQSFPFHLPRVLADLATCCFVAIDLEFSGIAKSEGEPSGGFQTLQARYEEVKKAAEKYQVLQVGLTICHGDVDTATYTLKPYNIYLSPIIDRKLELDRDFSFQSSAVAFLLGTKFRMESLFREGVSYLSRDEESLAMSKALERRDRSATRGALDIKETDHESLDFLVNTRCLVDDWIALGDTREHFLNIPPPTRIGGSEEPRLFPDVLNRFQKRLVHQLIEVEYPSLVTISKETFIQIISYDEEREKATRDRRYIRTQERIWSQIGFRWIAEALVGGDLANLESSYYKPMMRTGSSDDLHELADRLKQKVKSNRPILVGHNLFADLIYFTRCFFGPLPDKVEDFQVMAHVLFPTLVDTKYLATHDCGSINPTSSLAEIDNSLANITVPKIEVHPQHLKYNTGQAAHEAGYDSFLTARVFIKLLSRLHADMSKRCDSAQNSSSTGHGRSASATMISSQVAVPVADVSTDHSKARPISGRKRAYASYCRTRFDVLEVEDPADTSDVSTSSEQVIQSNAMEFIPPLQSEFWRIYGNRMRVFGTEERISGVEKYLERPKYSA